MRKKNKVPNTGQDEEKRALLWQENKDSFFSYRQVSQFSQPEIAEQRKKILKNNIINYFKFYISSINFQLSDYIMISIGSYNSSLQQNPPFLKDTRFSVLNIDPMYNQDESCLFIKKPEIHYLPGSINHEEYPEIFKALCDLVKFSIQNGKKVIILNCTSPLAAINNLNQIVAESKFNSSEARSLILLGGYFEFYPVLQYHLSAFQENIENQKTQDFINLCYTCYYDGTKQITKNSKELKSILADSNFRQHICFRFNQ